MERPITGFHRDAEGDWVAELSCGHGQHVRDAPPFTERAWTRSEAGRASRLGSVLDCVRCARRELPESFAPYRSTPEFDEQSVPAALLERHDTKPGVWGRIVVSRGQLEYTVCEPEESSEILEPSRVGVIPPELPHRVRPLGSVSFHVEFWRRDPSGGRHAVR